MPAHSIGDVVFVFDENLMGLAKGLAQLRDDAAVFGDTTLERIIPCGTLDADWIQEVGDRGWVVITNDRRLRTRPLEAPVAIDHRLKVVHLHGEVGSQRPWRQAERLLTHWQKVELQISTTPEGPWWLSLEAKRVRTLAFQPGVATR